MLKIIIPLGGSSELFSSSGYFYPKPLIEIAGKTMVELVLEKPSRVDFNSKFIFIVKEEDKVKFHLDNTLKLLDPNCEVVVLKNSTKGALCSVLMAIDKFEEEDSLLIINGDQIIDYDYSKFLEFWKNNSVDCGLVTFNSIHPSSAPGRRPPAIIGQIFRNQNSKEGKRGRRSAKYYPSYSCCRGNIKSADVQA